MGLEKQLHAARGQLPPVRGGSEVTAHITGDNAASTAFVPALRNCGGVTELGATGTAACSSSTLCALRLRAAPDRPFHKRAGRCWQQSRGNSAENVTGVSRLIQLRSTMSSPQ